MRVVFTFLLAGMLYFVFSAGLSADEEKNINVVLIVIDALRADHLGCYGYERDTSPNIDRFAKQAVLFKQAFSHGPSTRIAIPSLLSSLYPAVFYNGMEWAMPLNGKSISLPEILAKHGYETAMFASPVLEGVSGIDRRFQTAVIFPKGEQVSAAGGSLHMLDLTEVDSEITKESLAWMAKHQERPFFLYVHFLGAHDPYLPPAPYDAMFWKKEITAENREFLKGFTRARGYSDNYDIFFDNAMLDFILAQYDGEIRYADYQVGRIMEGLEKLNLSQKTMVILTADHGHAFGEHGKFFHDNALYDELINIPLLMRLPGVLPQGETINSLVRHIDMMPTVFDVLGLNLNNNIIQGASVLPLILNSVSSERESVSESQAGHSKAIRADGWLFIAGYNAQNHPQPLELYNLGDDPAQTVNLIKAIPESAFYRKAARDAGEKLQEKLKEYDASCIKLRSVILEGSPEKNAEILDEETKAALRSLGYIN